MRGKTSSVFIVIHMLSNTIFGIISEYKIDIKLDQQTFIMRNATSDNAYLYFFKGVGGGWEGHIEDPI